MGSIPYFLNLIEGSILIEEQGSHRQATGQVLTEKSKHYAFIVNTSKELMALIDRNYVYEAVNDAHCQARAQAREDIIGRTISDLWSGKLFRTTVQGPLDKCFCGEEVNYQAYYEHKALGLRYMDVTCYPYFDESSDAPYKVTHVVIVQRDITEREQAAHALQRYAQRLETLHQIDRGILAAQSSEEIAEAALNQLQFLVPYQRAQIIMFDSDSKITKNSEQASHDPSKKRDSYTLAEFTQAEWDQGVSTEASCIRIPLVAQGELLGEFSLASNMDNAFSDEHKEIVNEVASQVALAIQQAQLRQTLSRYTTELEDIVRQRTQEIEHRRQVAEGMRDVLTILNSVRPVDEVLEFIMMQARLLMSTDDIVFFAGDMFDPDAKETLIRSLETKNLTAQEIFLCQKMIPQAKSKLEPFVLSGDQIHEFLNDGSENVLYLDGATDTIHQNGQDKNSQSSSGLRYKTLLCVPIRLAPEVYGSFLLFYKDEIILSTEEIETITSLSDQASLAIENARLYQQAEQLAVMEERERLARDMHDSVMQSIYSLTLFSAAGGRQIRNGNIERVQEYLDQLVETAQQALKEMRLLLYELRPVVLEQEGLIGALRRRLDAVETRAGIKTTLDVPEPVVPPFYAEEGLYRIAQEALNNSLKHSGADRVAVRIVREQAAIVMQISDNGNGFSLADAQEFSGGMGLGNMHERMQKLQGEIQIESDPETGTTVTVRVGIVEGVLSLKQLKDSH